MGDNGIDGDDLLAKFINHHGQEGALRELSKIAGYIDVPATIEEFIEDEDLGGEFLGEGQLYPTWKDALIQIFPNPISSPYMEIAITGAIGTGKTYLACAGMMYDLYKILHLIEPQRRFGLEKSSDIIIAFINTTEVLAQAVAYNRFQRWLHKSPYMLRQMSNVVHIDKRRKPELLPHHISTVTASRGRQVLGQNVVMAMLSELNFQGEVVKDQAFQNYAQLRNRMESRFGREEGLVPPGRLWMDSSKSDETGYLENHMKSLAEDREHSLIISKSLWEVKERAGTREYSGIKFPVFIGDQTRDPHILDGPGAAIGIPEDLVMMVPVEYRPLFERNLIGSIRDLGGMSTWGSHRFLSQEQLVKAAMRQNDMPRPNPLRKEIVALDFEDDQDQLINYVDVDAIPKESRYFLHFDVGLKKDRTGFALTRSLGDIAVERTNNFLVNTMTRDSIFETVLVGAVVPRPGKEVPLGKLRNFIVHLIERRIIIVGVSCDQYQSREILQQAMKMGIEAEVVSTDKTRDAYDYLRDAINERRLRCPYHSVLERELMNLRDEGKKIDHPISDGNVMVEPPSKDVADALAGSVWFCGHKSANTKTVDQYSEYLMHLKSMKREVTEREKIQQYGLGKKNQAKFYGGRKFY